MDIGPRRGNGQLGLWEVKLTGAMWSSSAWDGRPNGRPVAGIPPIALGVFGFGEGSAVDRVGQCSGYFAIGLLGGPMVLSFSGQVPLALAWAHRFGEEVVAARPLQPRREARVNSWKPLLPSSLALQGPAIRAREPQPPGSACSRIKINCSWVLCRVWWTELNVNPGGLCRGWEIWCRRLRKGS